MKNYQTIFFIKELKSKIKNTFVDNISNNKEKTIMKIKKFYEQYRYIRETFVQHLKLYNPNTNPFDLLQFAQIIIDRIIFINIINDYNLIYYDILKRIEKLADESCKINKLELRPKLYSFFNILDTDFLPRIHNFKERLFVKNEAIEK